MDVISPNVFSSYSFDPNKPSPIHAFSSSLEEKRKSPQDGESTLRVRNVMKKPETHTMEPVFRPDSDDDALQRLSKTLPVRVRNELTAQAEASSEPGNVKKKVALFEVFEGNEGNKPTSPRHINLLELGQTKKNGMKPKQVGLSSITCTTAPATE